MFWNPGGGGNTATPISEQWLPQWGWDLTPTYRRFPGQPAITESALTRTTTVGGSDQRGPTLFRSKYGRGWRQEQCVTRGFGQGFIRSRRGTYAADLWSSVVCASTGNTDPGTIGKDQDSGSSATQVAAVDAAFRKAVQNGTPTDKLAALQALVSGIIPSPTWFIGVQCL